MLSRRNVKGNRNVKSFAAESTARRMFAEINTVNSSTMNASYASYVNFPPSHAAKNHEESEK